MSSCRVGEKAKQAYIASMNIPAQATGGGGEICPYRDLRRPCSATLLAWLQRQRVDTLASNQESRAGRVKIDLVE